MDQKTLANLSRTDLALMKSIVFFLIIPSIKYIFLDMTTSASVEYF
jgi:hypothetical protein